MQTIIRCGGSCENLEKRGINMKDSQNKGQKEPKEVIWGLM